MSPIPLESEEPSKTLLLREAVDLLQKELSALSNRQWDDLPELKKKKVVLASRMRKFTLTPSPMDREPFDFIRLKSLIRDLEDQSRQKIQVQLDLIGNQIIALQELHQYCMECRSISFQKF